MLLFVSSSADRALDGGRGGAHPESEVLGAHPGRATAVRAAPGHLTLIGGAGGPGGGRHEGRVDPDGWGS